MGKGGKSADDADCSGLCASTSSLRGSQKSKSVSEIEVAELGTGEGEGEREGQELMDRRSEVWLAVTEGRWMNTNHRTR